MKYSKALFKEEHDFLQSVICVAKFWTRTEPRRQVTSWSLEKSGHLEKLKGVTVFKAWSRGVMASLEKQRCGFVGIGFTEDKARTARILKDIMR